MYTNTYMNIYKYTYMYIYIYTFRGEGGGPPPKMLSSINNPDEQRNTKSQKTQTTKSRHLFYHIVFTILPTSENDPMADTHILV